MCYCIALQKHLKNSNDEKKWFKVVWIYIMKKKDPNDGT